MSADRSRPGFWPVLLAVAIAAVVADFLQHPFIGSTAGDAAAPARKLTIWMPRSQADAPEAAVLGLAAGHLGPAGEATVGQLAGGAAAALQRFAAGPPRPGAELFALSGSTLAELARDRRDPLLPEARLRAARAQRLLPGLVPIGVLSEDPLRLVAPRSSPISARGLESGLSGLPGAPIFGLTTDAWVEGQFAGLVGATENPEPIPYAVFPDAENVLLALAAADVDVALVPGSAAAARRRALRTLPWPGGRPAPARWVALVARPGTSPAMAAALRARISRLVAGGRWRRAIRASGRRVAPPRSAAQMRRLLRGERRRAARLQLLSDRLRDG